MSESDRILNIFEDKIPACFDKETSIWISHHNQD